jgi:uncharacterized membrane protein YeaQ/YmgE (transglycosylase-associated protein family)
MTRSGCTSGPDSSYDAEPTVDMAFDLVPGMSFSEPALRAPARHKTRSGGIITDVVIFIIWLCVIGLIIGAIARLLLPGRDNIGILGTIALGILGSFVGGFLENLIEYHTASVHTFHATGLIGSVIGALVLLLLLRVTGLEPGHRRRRRR